MKNRPKALLALRLVWVVFAILFLITFLTAVPPLYAYFKVICPTSSSDCQSYQIYPDMVENLAAIHLSIETVALFVTALFTGTALIFWVVGLLIFWRRSDDGFGLLVSFMMIEFGAGGPSFTFLSVLNKVPHSPILDVASLGVFPFYLFAYIFFLTFPNGRLAPRWSAGLIILNVMNYFVFSTTIATLNLRFWPPVLASAWLLLVYGSPMVVQVFRYRRIYTPEERQQTKWLIASFLFGLLWLTGLPAVIAIPQTGAAQGLSLLAQPVGLAVFYGVIPLAVAIAILRYRLWDIDIIIRRTLIYSVLTAILALIYFGGIVIVQAGLRPLIGENSDVGIVISTLVIAALFTPLRRRVQNVIDQRFYRRKYDAERTLAAFNATMRDEVDLDKLQGALVSVVQETMQPKSVMLWIREASPTIHSEQSS